MPHSGNEWQTMNNRDNLKKRAVKTNSEFSHLAFKQARNHLNK